MQGSVKNTNRTRTSARKFRWKNGLGILCTCAITAFSCARKPANPIATESEKREPDSSAPAGTGGDSGEPYSSSPPEDESTTDNLSTQPEQATTNLANVSLQQLQQVPLPSATFPLKLSELTDPRERSAHLRVHFSVLDAEGRAVSDLRTSDFLVRENNTQLDTTESALRIVRSNDPILAPVVLLLDLSRSVVLAGALERIIESANAVINALVNDQELSILVFADQARVLTDFSSDRAAHRSAVASLVEQEGNSTNLFGAMIKGYSLWQDGVTRPPIADAGVTPPTTAFSPSTEGGAAPLVVGMLVAISDGNDTASVATLKDVLAARGNKKTLFLRAGQNLDRLIAKQLSTLGVLDITESTTELPEDLAATFLRASQLDEALYVAEYCSPKRAGSHDLSLSLRTNTTFLKENPVSECGENLSPAADDALCPGTGGLSCSDSSGSTLCCPESYPFACVAQGLCRPTAEAAVMACIRQCTRCDRVGANFDSEDALIELDFSAENFSSNQCNAFFEAVDSTGPETPRPSPAEDAGTNSP